MKDKKIKKIPYGVTDYDRIIKKNCYYVDKTMYLAEIENAGDYLFFIRPRRFGKSLFASVMEGYYDVYYKDRFEELFKDTWIYRNPTEERGDYLVLKFNFSMVDPALDRVEDSFINHIRRAALSFLRRYSGYLIKDPKHYKKSIEESRSAADILSIIRYLCKDSQQKSYAIIDEYDNFANTILSTLGEKAYHDLTHGEGFFRAFFNVLKGGTDGMEAPFTRLFLTGVSPVTLDDVTSGFNIGKNISLKPNFNRMLGFTKDDVIQMIEYYRSNGMVNHQTDYLLDIMTQWYGNYLFSVDDETRLFNSDMVLYFIDNYINWQKLPDYLIDRNVRIDYGKLRHLIIVYTGKNKTFNGNFDRLKEIIQKGETSAELQEGFPLEELVEENNFTSLLFYFGLLSIVRSELNEQVLEIPNETIRRLYYDYIKKVYDETDIFSLNLSIYSRLMKEMASKGKWKPFLDYITGLMQESMGLMDLITGEKSIQAFLNVYLGLSDLYIIHCEKEMNKGFADIVMEPFLARYPGVKYSFVIEIKYIKPKKDKKTDKAKIEQLKTDAEEQLKKYSADEKFKKNIEKTILIKLVLIFSGHQLVHMGKVD
ncbi:MAG: AAA family ATPase [Candidatus Aminicenantes bacterium]